MHHLPDAWVDALFTRLAVRYGAAWLRMWEGIDMRAVRADWAEELAGFANRPEAIKHALASLPADRPPTVGQFKALCVNSPEPAPLALPVPKPSAEDKARIRSLLARAKASITGGAR